MARVKLRLAERKVTFRALVITALEQVLAEESRPFQLRDASVGGGSRETVSAEVINRAIDEQRTPSFER